MNTMIVFETFLVNAIYGKQDPGHGVLKKLIGETLAAVCFLSSKVIFSLSVDRATPSIPLGLILFPSPSKISC